MFALGLSFIVVAITFLVMDGVWLGLVARSFYSSRLGSMMADNINVIAAAVFYVLYTAGIVYFCVRPALNDESLRTAIVNGALLGLLAYGTYDLTNLAVLKGWPVDVSLADMAWGAVVTATSAGVAYAIAVRQLV